MAQLVITRVPPGCPPDYPSERTGRCRKCNIRFIWDKKLGSLKEMQCPHCQTPLSQTTHLFKGETQKLSSPYTDEEKIVSFGPDSQPGEAAGRAFWGPGI